MLVRSYRLTVLTHPLVVALGVVLASALLRLPRVGAPPTYVFDEVYYVYTAEHLARGDPRAWEWWNTPDPGFAFEWTHPPLSKLLIAAGIALAGDRPLAWRLPGALAVSLGSGIFFLLGRRLTRSTVWGTVAASFLLLDLLPLTQSRIATPEAFLYLFIPLALLYVAAFRETRRLRWLLAFGVTAGLLLATKWSAAPVVAVLGAAGVWTLARMVRARELSACRALVALLVGGVLLPLAVYLASYSPFFATGHTVAQFGELHRQMYWYHSRLTATHPYQSVWWEWPLTRRAIWYYTGADYAAGTVTNIYALGNPALWWPGIAAVLWYVVRSRLFLGARGRGTDGRTVEALLVAAYFLLWLPNAFSPRIMFLYHYLPSSLFLLLALTFALRRLARLVRRGRVLVGGYLLLVLLTFGFFYPIATGLPLSREATEARLLLPSWR